MLSAECGISARGLTLLCLRHSAFCSPSIGSVTLDEWITLPIRGQDEAAHTVRGSIRIPTVIVAVNFAKAPKKRASLDFHGNGID